jgi:hypothetical protein
MDVDVTDSVDVSQSEAPESTVDTSTPVESSPGIESAPEQQASATPWEAFKRLPEFQGADDRAIAHRLYSAMEREKAASRALAQYQQVVPYAQEYLANRREFEAWRKAQSQSVQQHPQVAQAQGLHRPDQQSAQTTKGWWNPPQVRDSYKRYLIKDESGREVIDPNAPPSAQEELYEYQQYKADFARKFLENPEGALGPMVQDLAAKQAQEIVQQQFEKVNNEQFVSTVEQQNSDWLFDPQTGNVTPEGLLVHKYVEEARAHGINGPQQRWQYAIAMTERDMLARVFDESQAAQASQYQQQAVQQFAPPAPAPQAQPAPQAAPAPQQDLAKQNMEYLRREAARNPSRSAGTANNDFRAPKQKRTFEELLREDASSRGLI